MSVDIGPKIGIQGESEYRKQLQDINNGIKTLAAETKAVTSAFIGEEKSMEALTSKNELLTARSEKLTEKIDLQKARLKELDDQGVDPTSTKYQQLLQQLYKTEEEFNKNEAEIKDNTAEMENLKNGADDAGDEVEELGDKSVTAGSLLKANLASEAIVAGVKALGNAIKDGVQALGDMIKNAAYAADDLNTMAKTTGLSTEELQKFQYASDLIDVSVDTLTGSMTKLTKNMSSAKDGSGAAYEAFKELGVEITDGNGELRDRNEVFNETIKALGEITNETERDAKAMDIFGKSAQDLNPLILGGADALADLGQQAEDAGLILSQGTLDDLNKVSDALDTFKATTSNAGQLFMAGFSEPIAGGVNLITGYIQDLTKSFSEGGWEALSDTLGDVLEDMSSKILEYLPQAVKFGADIVNRLILGITEMLPDIVAAGVTIITSLAESLAEQITELAPVAVEAILAIVDTLTNPDTLGNLIDAALAIILALANGILDSLPRLIEQAPVIIENLVTALAENLPKVLEAGISLIGKLIEGMVKTYATLLAEAPQIVLTVITGIVSAFNGLLNAGKDIVLKVKDGFSQKLAEAKEWGADLIQNFIDGIKAKFEKLKSAITNVANTVKSFLGFSEPEKGPLSDFHTYAPDMMKLYAQGIEANAWRVEDALNSATAGMAAQIPAPDISVADALAGAVNGMQGAVAGIGGGTYTFNLVLPDGTQLARYTLPSLINVASAAGTPILNPA